MRRAIAAAVLLLASTALARPARKPRPTPTPRPAATAAPYSGGGATLAHGEGGLNLDRPPLPWDGCPRPGGPPARVYLDGSSAPTSLQVRVEERPRAVLGEGGVAIASDPLAPSPVSSEPRLAAARRDLDRAVTAYRQLSFDAASAAFAAAEQG